MIKITKEEAKAIRKMNKKKGRPENMSLISAGIGKSALPEYIVWLTQNRNTSKMFNLWRDENKKEAKDELKIKIIELLTSNLENAKEDYLKLEALIDAYENIHKQKESQDILGLLISKIEERKNILDQADKYYKMTLKNLNR